MGEVHPAVCTPLHLPGYTHPAPGTCTSTALRIHSAEGESPGLKKERNPWVGEPDGDKVVRSVKSVIPRRAGSFRLSGEKLVTIG